MSYRIKDKFILGQLYLSKYHGKFDKFFVLTNTCVSYYLITLVPCMYVKRI